MLIFGDKGYKKFRATEEIKVVSFGSATSVPRDLGQSLYPGFPSLHLTHDSSPATLK